MGRLVLWGLGFISPSTPALPPPPISPRSGLTLRPSLMLPQFRFSLIPLLGPLTRTAGAGSVVSCSQLSLSVFFLLLASLLILRAPFDPLKVCSTDEGYMLPDSVVWDLSSLVWTHHIPKEMRGIQVMESLAPERLNDLHPKVFHHSCQSTFISLIVAVTHVLQGVSILHDCMLLCS